MNESVDGAQFNYSLSNISSSTVVYQSGWVTGHLGKRATIQLKDSQRVVSVALNDGVDILFNVSGVPDPIVELQKDGVVVNSDKHDLKNGVLSFSHVNESKAGNYTIKASNCFNSVTKTVTVTVLINASVESSGGSMNVKCGENLTLSCVVRASPPPDIRWYLSSLNSFEAIQRHYKTDIGGDYRYLSNLHIVNVAVADQGTYKCLINKGEQLVEFNVSVICWPSPPGVQVSGKNNETVTLSISAPSYTGVRPIEHYPIVFGSRHLLVNASSDPTLVTITSLTQNTLYMVLVTAHNGLNESRATFLSVQTEGVPGSVRVEWHSLFVESEIGCQSATIPFELSDDEDSGVEGYTVIVASVETEMELEVPPVNETEIVLDGLSENTVHTLQIKAQNQYGYGPGSKTYTFQTTECIVQVKSVGISVAAGVLAVMITFALLGAAYSRYRWRKLSLPIEPAMPAELSEQIELRGRIISKAELDSASVAMEAIQIELEAGQSTMCESRSPFEMHETNEGE
jgi:hypothetical protein